MAYDSGVNVAAGASVSGSVPATSTKPYTNVTNGIVSTTDYATADGLGLQYVVVDLGALHEVESINVRHYYNDGRTYNDTKTQVSEDGISWTTVFDSAVEGTYQEISSGHVIELPTTISLVGSFDVVHDVLDAELGYFNVVHEVLSNKAASFVVKHEILDKLVAKMLIIHSVEPDDADRQAKIITRINA